MNKRNIRASCRKCESLTTCLHTKSTDAELLKTVFICPARDFIELVRRCQGKSNWDAKGFDETFKAVLSEERLWFECKKCGLRFPTDAAPRKLGRHVLKHQFFVEDATSESQPTSREPEGKEIPIKLKITSIEKGEPEAKP